MTVVIVGCARHEAVECRGTVCCVACMRVYQVAVAGEPFAPVCRGAVRAPEVCACGAWLLGDEGSARIVCTDCFVVRVSANREGAN